MSKGIWGWLVTWLVFPRVLVAAELAVAWNDFERGVGVVQALRGNAPWDVVSDPLTVGRQPMLRFAEGSLYALSPMDDTLTVINPRSWTIDRTYELPAGSEAVDIALGHDQTAYVTRRNATHLLRLNLADGSSRDVLDMSGFADADGIPDLGTMALHDNRLLVQIQRLNFDTPQVFVPPPYLAVMDLTTEQLIDVDAGLPGIQAIELAGTGPKLKMQVIPESQQLFVSATGTFFDAGGLEAVNLETLRSEGLVIRESDGTTGADLGPFVMINPQRGFLATSTDFIPSSHLHKFSLEGVEPRELQVALDYLVPTLAYDATSGSIFFPYSFGLEHGVHVFDAETGERRNASLVAVGGVPTDITLVPEPAGASLIVGGTLLAMIAHRLSKTVRRRSPPVSNRCWTS